MSQRFRRALLKLYPSRIRRRYGEELLDLQDELRSQGELSALSLIRDATSGAFLVRSARQRALILGSGALVAALIATVLAVPVQSTHRTRSPVALVVVGNARPTVPYGQTCLVDTDGGCSPQGCAVFAATTASTASTAATASSSQDEKRGQAECVDTTPTRRPHTLDVSSSQFITAHVPQSRPTTGPSGRH